MNRVKNLGQIVFVRHAIAMDRTRFQELNEGPDFLRPLTPRGRRKMLQNLRGFKKMIGKRDVVLISSPLVRALQTADLIVQGLRPGQVRAREIWTELQPFSYIGPADSLEFQKPGKQKPGKQKQADPLSQTQRLSQLVQKLRQSRRSRSAQILLVIVGHEPTLALTTAKLLNYPVWPELRKGGALSLRFHSEISEVAEPKKQPALKCELEWALKPAVLRRLGS